MSLCIFTKISRSTINLKTENGSRLITEYYAFTIRVDQANFLREKFGVSAYSRISTVYVIMSVSSEIQTLRFGLKNEVQAEFLLPNFKVF